MTGVKPEVNTRLLLAGITCPTWSSIGPNTTPMPAWAKPNDTSTVTGTVSGLVSCAVMTAPTPTANGSGPTWISSSIYGAWAFGNRSGMLSGAVNETVV